MDDLRVAAVVMRSGFGETTSNLASMERFVRQAARSGAHIVCFPEMSITGYVLRSEIEKFAEPIPGPSTSEVQRMARENKVGILAGLAELTGSHAMAMTQVVVSPSGTMEIYRKLHLSEGEQGLFEGGCDAPVFKVGGTTFGVQLCYDAHFPELSTILALKGAEVFFMPHASPPPETAEQKRMRWLRYLSARAYDNSAFVVACNQTGDGGAGIRFSGVALILDPRGQLIAETSGDEERMIIADLKADTLRKTRNTRMGFFLARRRPELYGMLSASTENGAYERPEANTGFDEARLPEESSSARAASAS